jgi:HK97 family phage prohead protease
MLEATVLKTVNTNPKIDFQILKSDELYIGGYASIEIVDKQNDLITLEALSEAVKKYMTDPKYRNVMTNHSNVQVGEVVKDYRDTSGRLWKTDVDDVGFFVVIKLRDDIEKAKEVGREIRKGSLRSFSIGGQALEKQKRNNKELGDYKEISKLELHEVTICEKGINPEAKFDILKQDVGTMTNIEHALQELNILLKKIGVVDPITGKMPAGEESLEDVEARLLGNPDAKFDPEDTSPSTHDLPGTDLTIPEADAAREQSEEDRFIVQSGEEKVLEGTPEEVDEQILSDDEEELKMTEENDDIENEEYMDVSSEEEEENIRLSETDLPTGQVERGEQSEVIVEGGKPRNKHDQISVPSGSNPTDVGKSTWNGETHGLDLTHENLEKAYQQFKAEQMEKLAYDDIKRSFQGRLNEELSVKKASVERNDYDAQAEVTELKKQFSELLDTLKNDAEMTIVKQQQVVNDLNIPSYEDISNMDWNEIHLTMQRLEERR